jgi:dipeptidyl aminopeptidase/acylaminoacyl peptidase
MPCLNIAGLTTIRSCSRLKSAFDRGQFSFHSLYDFSFSFEAHIRQDNTALVRDISREHSVTILDVFEEQVLVRLSTPTDPFALAWFSTKDFQLKTLFKLPDTPLLRTLRSSKWSTFHSSAADHQIESILLQSSIEPQSDGSFDRCLIAMPHGGPHVNSTLEFNRQVSYFLLAGFDILLINYIGSTGYGQDFVSALPGHCGVLDVSDCFAAIRDALAVVEKRAKRVRLTVHGGSHGGFLASHFISQQQLRFESCVLRNPVVDLTAMSHFTDIPDWAITESGANDSMDVIEKRRLMDAMSPCFHAEKVKTPVLVVLGALDRRTPSQHGMMYYNKLRSNGVKVRIVRYLNDGHKIGTPEAESDFLKTSAQWLLKPE